MEPQASITRSIRVRSRGDTSRDAATKSTARSKVTNGTRLFMRQVDGRSQQARRWRDLYRGFLAETGGRNELLVRQLTTLIVMRERMDASLALGEPVDALNLVRVAGAINRTMSALGLVADVPEPVDATDRVLAAMGITP